MKMNACELRDKALDFTVAQCEESKLQQPQLGLMRHCLGYGTYNPSTTWSQGGPIIEREKIKSHYAGPVIGWECWGIETGYGVGPTPLIAAMRCYVASKLGDVVDVPDELVA